MDRISPLSTVTRLLEGRQAVVSGILSILDSRSPARAPVSAELFFVGRHKLVGALANRARDGGDVRLLFNHHMDTSWARGGHSQLARLERAGAQLIPYAPNGFDGNTWLHSKLLHVGGDRPVSILHNTVLDGGTGHTDIGVILEGQAAEAARMVTDTAVSGNPRAMAAAIDAAAQHGLLINDPIAARWYASDAMQGMLNARNFLDVTVKALDDPAYARGIAAAARRGAQTSVAVRDLAPVDARILRDSAVPTRILHQARPRLHHNVIDSDGLVYVGSAYPWTAMRRGDDLYGHSRDAGVLLAGGAARQARRLSDHMTTRASNVVDLTAPGAADAVRSQRDWILSRWPNAQAMSESDVERALRELDWNALAGRA